jgi:hypothetical protein
LAGTETYGERPFYGERDVVWTLLLRILDLIAERNLPFEVRNDERMFGCSCRASCTQSQARNSRENCLRCFVTADGDNWWRYRVRVRSDF